MAVYHQNDGGAAATAAADYSTVKRCVFSLKLLRRLGGCQRGQVFILVLVFLLVGGLIIAPLLNFMSTGLLTGRVYDIRSRSLYAADAGVEDALWQIKYDSMQAFSDYDPLAYYDYSTDKQWNYQVAEPVNGSPVDVTIRNVWIPQDINPPSPTEAANALGLERLTIYGHRTENDAYYINLTFAPASPEEKEDLNIDSIGVYLPPGFHYLPGSSTLEDDPLAPYYTVPSVISHAGGEAVVWDFGVLKFEELPPVGTTETATISFEYTSSIAANLNAVSWVTTSGVEEITYKWDDSHKFYEIITNANGTEVTSYVILPGHENLNIFGGALVSEGTISLAKDSYVSGDIIYEGSFTAQSPFIHENGELICEDVTFPDMSENVDFADGVKAEAQAIESWFGDYTVGIGNGIDVTNLGPIYISGNLSVARDNIINFNGPVYVEGSIDIDKDAEFTGDGVILAVGDIYLAKTNDFGGSSDSLIMSLTGDVTFKKEAVVSAIVYAPVGSITFDKSGVVNGSVLAANIQADKEGSFTQNYAYYGGIKLPGYSSDAIRPLTWRID